MKEYKDYIKSEIDEKGRLCYWIDKPLFVAADFNEAIQNNYKARLNCVSSKDNAYIKEFIKEELQDLQNLIEQKPAYDYDKLLFREKCFGGWFPDDTIEEFKNYFAEYRDYKYIMFYSDFLKNKIYEIENPKEKLLNNEYPAIFKDDFAFTLFEEMHKIYKNDAKHDLANYSFLFYAMRKDKFIRCGNQAFLEFLGFYDVSISKIDSRQKEETIKNKPLFIAKIESLLKRT